MEIYGFIIHQKGREVDRYLGGAFKPQINISMFRVGTSSEAHLHQLESLRYLLINLVFVSF